MSEDSHILVKQMIMRGWGRPGLEVMKCGFLETCKDNEQINWSGTFGTFFSLALVCTLSCFALVVGILLPFYPTEAWTAASWGGACFIFLCIFTVPLNNRLSVIFIEPILLLLPMSNSYPWANCFLFLGEFIKISQKGGKKWVEHPRTNESDTDFSFTSVGMM